MEDASEKSSQPENGEKTQAFKEENIAKAAASALAAAAVKAKVTILAPYIISPWHGRYTLGTRGFSRVRRQFSVLAEGRHIPPFAATSGEAARKIQNLDQLI